MVEVVNPVRYLRTTRKGVFKEGKREIIYCTLCSGGTALVSAPRVAAVQATLHQTLGA